MHGTQRGVMTMFHAVLWNGPISVVVGQIRHKRACSIVVEFHDKPLTFFHVLVSSVNPSIQSAIFKDGCRIEGLMSLSLPN